VKIGKSRNIARKGRLEDTIEINKIVLKNKNYISYI
jgi:hypothetical protein